MKHKTRREKKKDKRRQDEEREMKKKLKNVSRPSNPQDDLAQNVSKQIPVGRIVPLFFFESSESGRVFNYLHDSNSIFRVGGIDSEWVFRRTVSTLAMNSELSGTSSGGST